MIRAMPERKRFFLLMSSLRREISVDRIFIHEDYNETASKENDIALLRLGEFIALRELHLYFSGAEKLYLSKSVHQCSE